MPDSDSPQDSAVEMQWGSPQPVPPAARKWRRRITSICFILFALEIGFFLAFFPWTDYWILNHLQDFFPSIQDFWDDPYVKGAVSGLGVVNIYIACREVLRLVRGL